MTKTAATKLRLSYSPSNAQLWTVNAPPTPVCGVTHGVRITLGKWQDPYLQRLLDMEQRGSCMVPLVKVPKTEEQVCLTAMQLIRGPKKKESAFIDTIASLKEDNGAKRPFPPCMKKVLEGNNVVMSKKPPRRVPHKKEVDHKTELKEIRKKLKELREGIDRANGLLVTRMRKRDSVDDATTMRHDGGGECHVPPLHSSNLTPE
uniref:Uncharacterized protein n=1 Tax=Solanum tuberosum TaxID=4113 RepID=M1C642_SOLTU